MKRALMTFGNPFGLALYDKDKAGVVNDAQPSRAPTAQSIVMVRIAESLKQQIASCETAVELDELKRQSEFKQSMNSLTEALQGEVIRYGKDARAKMTPLIMAG
jgi:hypothetical protein